MPDGDQASSTLDSGGPRRRSPRAAPVLPPPAHSVPSRAPSNVGEASTWLRRCSSRVESPPRCSTTLMPVTRVSPSPRERS